jgi:hypothetical protein
MGKEYGTNNRRDDSIKWIKAEKLRREQFQLEEEEGKKEQGNDVAMDKR